MIVSCQCIAGAANTTPSSVLWLDDILPLKAVLAIAVHNVVAIAHFEAKVDIYTVDLVFMTFFLENNIFAERA